MPWSVADAERHTKKADTEHLRHVWAVVANDALKQGHTEASAIRIANNAVDKERRDYPNGPPEHRRIHHWL